MHQLVAVCRVIITAMYGMYFNKLRTTLKLHDFRYKDQAKWPSVQQLFSNPSMNINMLKNLTLLHSHEVLKNIQIHSFSQPFN